MRLFYLIVSITISVLTISCDYCTQPISNDAMYNVWVKYDDDFNDPNTFRSANKLDKNRYGFIIESDGTFIHRQNSGWCGTPPIAYKNYNGTWKELSKDTLEIISEFWGGLDTFKIEILSVTGTELKINYIYRYEEDE